MSRRLLRVFPGVMVVVRPRGAATVVSLLAACLATGLVSVAADRHGVEVEELWRSAAGGAELDPIADFVITGLRAPRAIAAAATGAALGLAGAIFQAMARNPLASPHLVGFTTGSATGALVMLLVAGATSAATVAAAAVAGGALTAAFVAALALRGGLTGHRLILVGLATAAMLASVNDYLLTRADLERAQAAKVWLFGSLNGVGWAQVEPLLLCGAALVVAAALLAPRLRALELGDEVAAALGSPVRRDKLALIALAVALTGLACSVAGPIGFIALAAPQLGRRLARAPGMSLAAAAATGALLVIVADFLAQRLLSPFQIPVGLVAGAFGGLYLASLLASERRRLVRRGGL